MKMNVFIIVLVLAGLLCLTACDSKEPTIELTSAYDGATVDLCDPEVRAYLNAETEEEQIKTLLEKEEKNHSHQTVSFSWTSDESSKYTLYIADNEEFENAYTFETTQTEMKTGTGVFIPGKTYYWKVVGDAKGSTSKVDTFQTLDAPVRFITTTDIPNVRDLGGWQTEDGKTVKYGLVYRGGKTNTASTNGCSQFDMDLFANTLGIETEIDLRTQDADDGSQSRSVFGDGVFYYKTTLTQCNYIFPDFEQEEPVKRSYDSRSKYSIREIFRVLADEENYPIYIHCNAGADRTGTVAFLINGVLGVSYEDLTRDFELTSGRYRSVIVDGKFTEDGVMQDDEGNYIAWGKMYQTMMQDYGTEDGTLASAIENYLMTVCKVKEEEIESVKSIMLE